MEKNDCEFDHAVQVLGKECAWTSRNLPHRFKAPPPQPPSLKKIPPMLTKTFAEEEARALFRSQEIDKVNKEMLQVAMAISEKEIGNCRETVEAVATPATSDEWTKVPEDQRNAIDPLGLVDPWAKTTDGKGIKTLCRGI